MGQAEDVWNRIYGQGREDNAPWLGAGQGSIDSLAMLLGLSGDDQDPRFGSLTQRFGMDDFQEDPGYQFRLGEGQKALERGQSARGNFMSPAAMKEIGGYNQGMASQEYGAARGRFNQDNNMLYDRLMGVSGQGQNAANSNTQLGMGYASGLSNIYMQQEALRQAQSGGGGLGGMAGGLANLAGGYFGGGGSLASLAALSDERLKENIEPAGQENGHNVYKFNYIGEDDDYVGVMAQEVQETNPDAVFDIGDGTLAVDYGLIGVNFRRA